MRRRRPMHIDLSPPPPPHGIVFAALVAAALALSFALSGLAYGAESPATLSALESLPVHRSDRDLPAEDLAEFRARVARAVERATEDRALRILLVVIGRHESGFATDVCLGRRLGDGDRAFGCWQSWEADRSGGIDGQARRAAEHLRRAGNYCAARGYPRVAGAVSLYATGRSCRWEGAAERVREWRRLYAQAGSP